MGLLGMGGLFVPFSLIFLALAAHLGSVTTVLFRDYMPALSGLLFAWGAAHLPISVLWIAGIVPMQPGAPMVSISQWIGLGLFAAFAIPVLSTVTSAALPQCAMGAVVAGTSAIVVSKLLGSSNLHYMLVSPWILFLLYQRFAGDMGMLGGGLAARQNFKRQLELATINPLDADAHYQLGLLYLQRHALTEAEASLRRAVEIDPNEPDALFHLGRLLRQRPETAVEARQLLERAAHLNPKLSNYEVWRELGGAALASNDVEEALAHLEPYTKAREFDPEGMVLYGQALRAASRENEARLAFEKAIEAARTAPDFRRHELKRWEAAARKELGV